MRRLPGRLSNLGGMMSGVIGYTFARILAKILPGAENVRMNEYFKKQGVTFRGSIEDVNCYSNISKNEPHLIEIGENVTIAGNVEFVTHDNSICKVLPEYTDLFGRICIGDNCFIGVGSIILYGVSIPENVIVAAGSVVTRSISQSNVIIGGNPAKIIGSWDAFAQKMSDFGWDMDHENIKDVKERHSQNEKLVVR